MSTVEVKIKVFDDGTVEFVVLGGTLESGTVKINEALKALKAKGVVAADFTPKIEQHTHGAAAPGIRHMHTH